MNEDFEQELEERKLRAVALDKAINYQRATNAYKSPIDTVNLAKLFEEYLRGLFEDYIKGESE